MTTFGRPYLLVPLKKVKYFRQNQIHIFSLNNDKKRNYYHKFKLFALESR